MEVSQSIWSVCCQHELMSARTLSSEKCLHDSSCDCLTRHNAYIDYTSNTKHITRCSRVHSEQTGSCRRWEHGGKQGSWSPGPQCISCCTPSSRRLALSAPDGTGPVRGNMGWGWEDNTMNMDMFTLAADKRCDTCLLWWTRSRLIRRHFHFS